MITLVPSANVAHFLHTPRAAPHIVMGIAGLFRYHPAEFADILRK